MTEPKTRKRTNTPKDLLVIGRCLRELAELGSPEAQELAAQYVLNAVRNKKCLVPVEPSQTGIFGA